MAEGILEDPKGHGNEKFFGFFFIIIRRRFILRNPNKESLRLGKKITRVRASVSFVVKKPIGIRNVWTT